MVLGIKFTGMDRQVAHDLRQGKVDSYGKVPESKISDTDGLPCRVCLAMIRKDEPYLIAAHRPFSTLQPYAETGPVFLHAHDCTRSIPDDLPEVFDSPDYIVRGYGLDERILYGTGGVTTQEKIKERAAQLLDREDVAFVDVRSASNNCWHARIVRDK